MAINAKVVFGAVCVTTLVVGWSFGQMVGGNRILQRGFATQDFGLDGLYDQSKYAVGQVHLHTYPPSHQYQQSGYQAPGWNSYQQATGLFNQYQKLGYAGFQHPSFGGGGGGGGGHQMLQQQQQQGFSTDNQLFSVPQHSINFVGNRRLRVL